MNRRTSVYTLRVTAREHVSAMAAVMRDLEVPINDYGDLALSYRAADDEAAEDVARRVVGEAEGMAHAEVLLTTGLGIHRRTVTTL